MKSKLLVILIATLALPFLAACETKEDRTLAEAEACINRATAANVDACVNKVAGMTSEDAYLIRCSSHFIAQDITETKLATGFAQIKSPIAGGVPSMTFAMSYLMFDNVSLPLHTSDIAKNHCLLSGAKSLYNFVVLSDLASVFSNVPTTPAGLAAAIGAMGAGSDTEIGNQAIEIKSIFCDQGNFSGTDICSKVNAAFVAAGGSVAALGAQIRAQLR